MAVLFCTILAASFGQAAVSEELVVRYLLTTVQAFRKLYVTGVGDHVERAGIYQKEDWLKDDHAIMLPFQFVKLAAAEVNREFKNIEVGIISLTPIYSSNFPKTEAEVNALNTIMANQQQRVFTFKDGNQFKGLAADFAIHQTCVDCHNHHPNSTRRDFKKGDLMGAIVVRLSK
jgi:hypothetical protein